MNCMIAHKICNCSRVVCVAIPNRGRRLEIIDHINGYEDSVTKVHLYLSQGGNKGKG